MSTLLFSLHRQWKVPMITHRAGHVTRSPQGIVGHYTSCREKAVEKGLTKLGHPHLSLLTVAVLPLSSLSLFERDISVFSFECHVLSDVIFTSKKTGWPQRHSSTLAKVVARAIYVQMERAVLHKLLSNALVLPEASSKPNPTRYDDTAGYSI